MSLTSLFVYDKARKRIHRIGDDHHDALYVINGEIRYHNIQNGDGGGIKDEDGCGYVILESEDGFLEGEFGIIDKRFETEIQAYFEDPYSPIISRDSLGDCNSCGNIGTSTCNSCVNGSRYIKGQDCDWRYQ